jgi:SMI1 / KNR4 family (SUKH-1)
MKPYEKLLRYWQDTASVRTVKMNQESVDRLKARYGIRLPDDFRDYLLHACPKEESENMDDEGTAWWPLDRLLNIPDEYPHTITDPAIAKNAAKYVFFADYMIWCWAWAIDCSEDKDPGRVAVIGGPDRFVADSFAEFVDRYIEDQTQIW